MNGASFLFRPRNRGAWVLVAAVAGLVVGLVAGPVAAGVMSPGSRVGAPAAAVDQPPEHTISVGGTGKVVLVPDQATIRLGVSIEQKTAKAARDAAATAMTRVVAAVRNLGIAERDIATSLVSLGPVYDYDASPKTPRIRGYQLSNVVTITVRNLDVLGPVLDDSVTAGATTVDGVTFEVADSTAAEKTAREAAIRDARAKADTLASGAGVRITGVASIAESIVVPAWYGRNYAAADAGAGTPILAGTTDVVVTVAVTFLIG